MPQARQWLLEPNLIREVRNVSAFIEDKEHMDVLVRAADHASVRNRHPMSWFEGDTRHSLTDYTSDELGQVLTDWNVRSVSWRYPDCKLSELPGQIDHWWTEPYKFAIPTREHSEVQVLKAIDGYEYQACEHPDWEQSNAYAFLNALRREFIRLLPGYDEGDGWAISA